MKDLLFKVLVSLLIAVILTLFPAGIIFLSQEINPYQLLLVVFLLFFALTFTVSLKEFKQ